MADRYYVAPIENQGTDADAHPWNYWIIDSQTSERVGEEYRTLRYAERECKRLNEAAGAWRGHRGHQADREGR